MHPKRGEVWWVRLDPTVGSEIQKTRPCVVMTNDVFNRRRKTVVVVPISSSAPSCPPLTVAVEGQRVRGVAVIEHVRGVSKERFAQHYDSLSDAAMEEIGDALKKLLDIE
jgi:mRNA interferase MazF